MVLTAYFHSTNRRIGWLFVSLSKGSGPRSAAHPAYILLLLLLWPHLSLPFFVRELNSCTQNSQLIELQSFLKTSSQLTIQLVYTHCMRTCKINLIFLLRLLSHFAHLTQDTLYLPMLLCFLTADADEASPLLPIHPDSQLLPSGEHKRSLNQEPG